MLTPKKSNKVSGIDITMRMLPNKCRMGRISFTPENWQTCGVSALETEWKFMYVFYDDNTGKEKKIVVKGFAKFNNLIDRRKQVINSLRNEIDLLEQQQFNPIEKQFAGDDDSEINKKTGFIDALKYSLNEKSKSVTKDTMGEIGYYTGVVEKAAKALNLDKEPIWTVGTKILHTICEKAAYQQPGGKVFSGSKYNRIKKVVRQLYPLLVTMEVAPFNIAINIPRQKEDAKQVFEGFTPAERKILDEHCRTHQPHRMWLFLRMYFHSGARATELLRVKRSDVDLNKQSVKYLILKGKQAKYEVRPILDNALEFWQAACEGVADDMYLFGDDMNPGTSPYTKDAMKKRWQRIQKATGIKKGMYDMKRSHTTGVVTVAGETKAAALNAESVKMINKHYDLDHKSRKMDELRGIDVPFLPDGEKAG